MAAKKLKSSERTTLIGKLTTPLKKRYGSKPPEPVADRGVLETLIFGTLVENAGDEPAEKAYADLINGFHDLNEIRVSSIREIERTIPAVHEADWKSLRIKDALQHIFEINFTYDLESLRKKNQDAAASDLGEVPNSTPFMRAFTLQNGLGNHVVPIDRHSLYLLRWLGLTEPSVTGKLVAEEVASDELKSAIRKADGPLFAYLLRQAANEPTVLAVTSEYGDDAADDVEEFDPKDRIKQIDDLIDGKVGSQKPAKKASKSSGAKSTATKTKKAAKKASKKAAKKASK